MIDYQRVHVCIDKNESLACTIEAIVSSVGELSHLLTPPDTLNAVLSSSSGNDFFVVMHCDSQDNELWQQHLKVIAESKRRCHFPEFVFVANQLSLAQEKQLHEVGIKEVLQRPLNLRRLREILEDSKIRHRHFLTNQPVVNSLLPSKSPFATRLQKSINKIANLELNIMLSGETGVGKTFIARQIHDASKRANAPFVVVDCSSVPANLVESELFGHAKGSFTGATSKTTGQFEHVGKGTILLDEVDSLPLAIQAKLLRVVENRKYKRVGENNLQTMHARIISATNVNLEQLMSRGNFRADLFYRLCGYEIPVPRLSERIEEVEPFCQFFAEQFANENSLDRIGFDVEAIEVLKRYHWPGNLRQLRNCVFRSVVDADGPVITVDNLPKKIVESRQVGGLRIVNKTPSGTEPRIQDFGHSEFRRTDLPLGQSSESQQMQPPHSKSYDEAEKLIMALEHNDYNRSKTAKELGVSRMTVYNMMKRHQLE